MHKSKFMQGLYKKMLGSRRYSSNEPNSANQADMGFWNQADMRFSSPSTKEKLISKFLRWTPTHGRTSVGFINLQDYVFFLNKTHSHINLKT